MRALTVQQPWAGLIAAGIKPVENRTWKPAATLAPNRHFAIHAGAGKATADDLEALTYHGIDVDALIGASDAEVIRLTRVTQRAVIAVARFIGAHPCGQDPVFGTDCCTDPWALEDCWHWQIGGVAALADPVPVRGALGLWTLPDDVESAVRAQLPAVI